MTSALLFIAMREVLLAPAVAAAVAGIFICVDSAFVVANFDKLLEGGYVPLLLATSVYAIMVVALRLGRGHAGIQRTADSDRPVHGLCRGAEDPRVPGTAVFLTAPCATRRR
ncbi:MAG: KUP/HAK/KT family potassium transporter [Xanthobacteraceae bacterium]